MATLLPLAPTLFIRSMPGFGVEPHRIPELMELLTLFTLLSRLDLQAWRDQVIKTRGDLECYADAALAAGKPFKLGVDAIVQDLPLLRGTLSSRLMSAAYENFCTRAAEIVVPELVATPEPVPVRMVLSFTWVEDNPEQRLLSELQQVLEVAKAMHSHTSRYGAKSQVFAIQEVCIEHQFRLLADTKVLDCLLQLASLGVRIPDLPGIRSIDRSRILEGLQVLIHPEGSSSVSPGVSTVVLSDRSSWEATQAVLSALVYSRSVRRVVMDCHRPSSRPKGDKPFWRWVGYALYSRESNAYTNVWQLPFDLAVQVEEVAIMRSVVEAADPLGLLMGEERDPETDDVLVSASRFFFSAQSTSISSSAADYEPSEMLEVRAIKKTAGGYSVLLPGYGKAWVRAADVVKVSKRSTSTAPRGANLTVPIQHLSWYAMDTAVAYFSLVGDRVRTLDIRHASSPPNATGSETDAYLRSILESCPGLKELSLGTTDLASLRVFEKSPNLRKLTRANFARDWENADQVVYFFETLSNPRHPLSRNLEEVSLMFGVSDANVDAFISMVEKLLDSNSRLSSIVFTVVTGRAYKSRFKALKKMKNLLCVAPLSTRSKLAAIDAMSRPGRDRELDSSLLSTIFDFAAHAQPRLFYLELQ